MMFEANLKAFFSDAEPYLSDELNETGKHLQIAFQSLSANHDRIQSLYEITSALSRAATLHEVVKVVVEKFLNPIGQQSGMIGLISEDSTMIETLIRFSEATDVTEINAQHPLLDKLPLNASIRTRQPVWIETPEQFETLYPEIFRATPNLYSLVCLPLFINGHTIGGMEIGFRIPTAFSPDERTLHLIIAGHCAIAIERARLYAEIQRQDSLIRQKNEELQQFAHVASHDLKEPLRKIRQFSDRLIDSAADKLNTQERDYLRRLHNAAQRMQNLIENLLLYARVTTHTVPFEAVNLNRVLQNVVSDLELHIKNTQGVVHIGDLATLEADPSQLWQLFQNLVNNSLKFHRPDVPPIVHISSTLEDEVCHIIVQDNGIGFEEKNLELIFAPFQQLHGRSEYEGSGMGLAICKRIAERHHGTITATGSPGQGATFTVTLPLKQPEPARPKSKGFAKATSDNLE